jgi:hypothetical protein
MTRVRRHGYHLWPTTPRGIRVDQATAETARRAPLRPCRPRPPRRYLPTTTNLKDMVYSAGEAVGYYRRSALIISDAFSAIIKVGELVLPLVMLGITDASTTRRPRNP